MVTCVSPMIVTIFPEMRLYLPQYNYHHLFATEIKDPSAKAVPMEITPRIIKV